MGFFGKKTLTVNKLLSYGNEVLLPTRENVEDNWWPIVANEGRVIESKSQVVRELLLLRLFAIDLAIFSTFEGRLRDAMRDQLFVHGNTNMPDIANDISHRQKTYGETWANHSRPDLPDSYSVVKKFIGICGIPDSVIVQMGVTQLFSAELTSAITFLNEIQENYEIIL